MLKYEIIDVFCVKTIPLSLKMSSASSVESKILKLYYGSSAAASPGYAVAPFLYRRGEVAKLLRPTQPRVMESDTAGFPRGRMWTIVAVLPRGWKSHEALSKKMQTHFAVCCASNGKKNLPAAPHSNPVSIRTKKKSSNNFDIREVLSDNHIFIKCGLTLTVSAVIAREAFFLRNWVGNFCHRASLSVPFLFQDWYWQITVPFIVLLCFYSWICLLMLSKLMAVLITNWVIKSRDLHGIYLHRY